MQLWFKWQSFWNYRTEHAKGCNFVMLFKERWISSAICNYSKMQRIDTQISSVFYSRQNVWVFSENNARLPRVENPALWSPWSWLWLYFRLREAAWGCVLSLSSVTQVSRWVIIPTLSTSYHNWPQFIIHFFQSPADLSGGVVQAAHPQLLLSPVPRLPPDSAAAHPGHFPSQSAE